MKLLKINTYRSLSIVIVMGIMIFVSMMHVAKAQTTSASVDIESLVEIIASLQVQVEELQSKIKERNNAMRSNWPAVPMEAVVAMHSIDRNLKQGDQGEDVRLLQQILNQHPTTQVTVPGEETNYFGPATREALKRFQEQHRERILQPLGLKEGSGVFAERTRALLEEKVKSGFVLPVRPQVMMPKPSGIPNITKDFSLLPKRNDARGAYCTFDGKQYKEGQIISATSAQLANNRTTSREIPKTYACTSGFWQMENSLNNRGDNTTVVPVPTLKVVYVVGEEMQVIASGVLSSPRDQIEVCGSMQKGEIDWGDGTIEAIMGLGCSGPEQRFELNHEYQDSDSYVVVVRDAGNRGVRAEVTVPYTNTEPVSTPLSDTKWRWRQLLDGEGKVVSALSSSNPFVVTFSKDMSFSSQTDCNTMGGEYRVEGENITFGEMFSTLMYCEVSREEVYRSLLGAVESYEIKGTRLHLILSGNDGSLVFTKAQ